MIDTQKGFSLIELLIAIGLSAVLLLGISQIFIANKLSFNTATAYSHVQESGRFATELLARDIRIADYWGCLRNTGDILDHLDDTDPDYDGSITGVSGIDGTTTPLTPATVISGITVRPQTDTLTIRGAKPLDVKVSPPYMTTNSSDIHVTLNAGADVPLGQLVLITNCLSGDLFSNSSNNTLSGGNILHNEGSISVDGAVNNAFKETANIYTADAQILTPYIKTYFIGQNPQGGWSLYLSVDGVASEYVRDVTGLQFIYGEDTGGNGSADVFDDAAGVGDMDNVVSIRAVLTAESDSDIDESLSRDYSITANIRNRTL